MEGRFIGEDKHQNLRTSLECIGSPNESIFNPLGSVRVSLKQQRGLVIDPAAMPLIGLDKLSNKVLHGGLVNSTGRLPTEARKMISASASPGSMRICLLGKVDDAPGLKGFGIGKEELPRSSQVPSARSTGGYSRITVELNGGWR